jgi:hypothetical protein
MVLVIGGVIVVVKVSRSQSEGFVHYESSLSPSERSVLSTKVPGVVAVVVRASRMLTFIVLVQDFTLFFALLRDF